MRMANLQRTVFLISDSTGITLEKLSHSLLSQFPQVNFTIMTHRYIDTTTKVESICDYIHQVYQQDQLKPLVFTSLLNQTHRSAISTAECIHYDIFEMFMGKLNQVLDLTPTPVSGLSHAVANENQYESRIEAINFALKSDDGLSTSLYEKADVILLGVSRAGKTPTCLYLAMNYGILAANYPITEEDMQFSDVPDVIKKYKSKCFALTIEVNQLTHIRNKRRPDSKYASVAQCRREINFANNLFRENNIECIDTSTTSIEELATSIISKKNLVFKQ